MAISDRPKLRGLLAAQPLSSLGAHYLILDQLRPQSGEVRVTAQELACLQLFNGEQSVRAIQKRLQREAPGNLVTAEAIQALAARLDAVGFLDGPIRQPSCLGSYPDEPEELRLLLGELFDAPGGAGRPSDQAPDNRLRAALVPHIDYGRGGLSYTWAFREVVEHTQASLFVIIGTSHYSGERFILTRKHFQTPLGIATTDQDYIDKVVAHYGDGLFDDENNAHLPEHSIELEVVFLQYLYENVRPIRIVPLLVGSFHDCIAYDRLPGEQADIRRMVEALRAVEAETNEPICYIISGDLAHLGPHFEREEGRKSPPLNKTALSYSKKQDQLLLKRAEGVDADDYFRFVADERDARRICGLSPTWTVLAAARPASGRTLNYAQYVQPDQKLSVSFASVAFYR